MIQAIQGKPRYREQRKRRRQQGRGRPGAPPRARKMKGDARAEERPLR